MLLQELAEMKHATLGVSKSTADTKQRAENTIRKAAENKAARTKIKQEKDLDHELTTMGKADKAKWIAKENQQKATAKASSDKKKAEAKEIRDLEKELKAQNQPQRKSSRIPKPKTK